MNRGDLCALPRPAVLWVATGFCARTWYLRENHFQWEENPRRVYIFFGSTFENWKQIRKIKVGFIRIR
jgi:hypothetical protein